MTSPSGRVAILIRTKNRSLTLERALMSIAQQTMSNWHIHLLNDGGDHTRVRELLQKYHEQLEGKITLYHNEQSVGRGGALSQLLHSATEEYCLIHDDDDTIEPDFLYETVSFLDNDYNSNCSAVVTSNVDVDARIHNNHIHIENIIHERGKKENSYIDIMSFIKAEIGEFPPIACLFRRQAALPFLENIKNISYHEDKALFSYMLLDGEFATINKHLACYYHYKSNNPDYAQTNFSERESLIKEMNNHVRKGISQQDDMSKLICLLQNERRENEFLRQLIVASHNEMTKSLSIIKDDMTRSMQAVAETLQALNTKIDLLKK